VISAKEKNKNRAKVATSPLDATNILPEINLTKFVKGKRKTALYKHDIIYNI